MEGRAGTPISESSAESIKTVFYDASIREVYNKLKEAISEVSPSSLSSMTARLAISALKEHIENCVLDVNEIEQTLLLAYLEADLAKVNMEIQSKAQETKSAQSALQDLFNEITTPKEKNEKKLSKLSLLAESVKKIMGKNKEDEEKTEQVRTTSLSDIAIKELILAEESKVGRLISEFDTLTMQREQLICKIKECKRQLMTDADISNSTEESENKYENLISLPKVLNSFIKELEAIKEPNTPNEINKLYEGFRQLHHELQKAIIELGMTLEEESEESEESEEERNSQSSPSMGRGMITVSADCLFISPRGPRNFRELPESVKFWDNPKGVKKDASGEDVKEKSHTPSSPGFKHSRQSNE